MAYMLLIQEPVGQRETRTEAEGHAAYTNMLKFADDLKSRGILHRVESLGSLATATRVKVRDGRPQILDGPFAEAKEMVGSFFSGRLRHAGRSRRNGQPMPGRGLVYRRSACHGPLLHLNGFKAV